eukprot:2002361-Alexandrium_andersonii.AAC.1
MSAQAQRAPDSPRRARRRFAPRPPVLRGGLPQPSFGSGTLSPPALTASASPPRTPSSGGRS